MSSAPSTSPKERWEIAELGSCFDLQNGINFRGLNFHAPFTAGSTRHVAKDLIDEWFQAGAHFGFVQCTADQPNSAIDVESDAAWRYDAVIHVDCGNTAYWETVPLVNVRHGEAWSHNAGQRGDIDGLR